jgi:hypothetical protein
MTDTNAQIAMDDSFAVKESQGINYLFAAIFLVIAIGGFVTMSRATYQSLEAYRYIFLVSFIPAFIFWSTGKRKTTIFEISSTGIFYRKNLVTTWANFVNAYLVSEEVPGSLSEHFLLLVEYFEPEKNMNYRIKLAMSSSQDKSEDQILAVVTEFYKKYQSK